MSTVLMIGSIAAALLSVVGITTVAIKLFTKAVKSVIKEELSEIHKQFEPNGGASLRDSLNRLEAMMITHIEEHS